MSCGQHSRQQLTTHSMEENGCGYRVEYDVAIVIAPSPPSLHSLRVHHLNTGRRRLVEDISPPSLPPTLPPPPPTSSALVAAYREMEELRTVIMASPASSPEDGEEGEVGKSDKERG